MANLLIARLTRLKDRLGLTDSELQHDALLTAFLEALTDRFDRECCRTFLRVQETAYEFDADELEVRVPAYPIEQVIRFELKEDEVNGWQAVTDAAWLVRKRCVISLPRALGSYLEQARVVYTGGYVPPGMPLVPGQTALPLDVENAAVEQAAFWFRHRDSLGLLRAWDYHGTYRQFPDGALLPLVRATLERHERWTL